MQATEVQRPRRTRWLRTILLSTGVILASGLSFAIGYLVAGDVLFVSRDVVVGFGGVGALLVAFQLLIQIAVLSRAERTETDALVCARALDDRNEQLRLTGLLTDALGGECGARQVAAAAVEFTTGHLGSENATFWRLDGDGLPFAYLSGETVDPGSGKSLPEDRESAALARKAARGGEPVIVIGSSGQPSRERPAHDSPFTLFLPLLAKEDVEGVLEIETGGGVWDACQWDIVGGLGRQMGVAFKRARQYEEMQKRADIDFVTGAYNYRFMQSYLHRVISAAGKRDREVAVLFLDIDNFKAFNDTLGHGAGDRVLQTVAGQLRLMTERVGIVGRSGGDEFMVVLPGHTELQARALIEAFQDWLSVSAPPVSGMFRVRVSGGYAVFPHDADNRQGLLGAADARLYQAKNQNKSRPTTRGGNGQGERTIGVYGLLDRIVDEVDRRDNYTRVHSEKTAEYVAALAQRLDLSPSAHRVLRLAALLHDVGKVGVPGHILCKPGVLDAGELAIVRHQIEIASQLIVDVPNSDEVRQVVRHLRERWDGTGYPDGLAGDDVPYLSRVLAVADAYAAITLDRPYKAALSGEDAYEELVRSSGTQLDSDMVAVFAAVVKTDQTQAESEAVPSAT
ncbi:MAG: diguanylate cyclase [Chloroflexi bacterium]|nr:diguanylate cyclase [Chloroflexota bacterium]